jgi:hypothetical protein
MGKNTLPGWSCEEADGRKMVVRKSSEFERSCRYALHGMLARVHVCYAGCRRIAARFAPPDGHAPEGRVMQTDPNQGLGLKGLGFRL